MRNKLKILVIALSGIGDALMFSPAIAALRKNLSHAQIDVLCMIKGVKEIYEANPNVNNVIYFNFIKEGFTKSLFFLFKIRKKYDVSFNVYPSNRKEYNVISFIIGAKKRFAVKYLRMDFQNFGFLNNYRIHENDNLHNVEENILLVERLINKKLEPTDLELFLDEKDIPFANNFFISNSISDEDFVIGFHAGCALLKNHIKRRWEPEKFAELGLKLIKEYNSKILLFGGPEEYKLNQQINSLMNYSAVQVETNTLLKTAAIMKRCNLFITNDSALMHISSALKLNTLAIFGPTNTNYVHPWKTNFRIAKLNLDCQPCFYYSPRPLTCSRKDVQFKCIKQLTVDYVFNIASEFIKREKRIS